MSILDYALANYYTPSKFIVKTCLSITSTVTTLFPLLYNLFPHCVAMKCPHCFIASKSSLVNGGEANVPVVADYLYRGTLLWFKFYFQRYHGCCFMWVFLFVCLLHFSLHCLIFSYNYLGFFMEYHESLSLRANRAKQLYILVSVHEANNKHTVIDH